MERKGLVIVVILLLTGFIFLWNHNSAADKGVNPEATEEQNSQEKVVYSSYGNIRWVNQQVIDMTSKVSSKDVFSVQISAEGAAIKSVRLHDEQYKQKQRPENAPAFLPAELVAPGSHEIVNVHKVSQFPFQFSIDKPSSSPSVPSVTRVIRKTAKVSSVDGKATQLKFSEPMGLHDLFLQKGDIVQFESVEIPITSIVLTDKISSGASHVDVIQTVSLAKPIPTPVPNVVTVIRRGDIYNQYAVDASYTCIDCEPVENQPNLHRPTNGDGKATFVWPNPLRDESDVWLERTWQVTSDYRLKHTSRIINLGSEAFKTNSSIQVMGWVDPSAVDVSMFSSNIKPLTPACYVGGEFEEEMAQSLDESEDGNEINFQGSVEWFGVNAQYFILAGVFLEEEGLTGSCSLWSDDVGLVASSLLRKLNAMENSGVDPFSYWHLANLRTRLSEEWGNEPTVDSIRTWLKEEKVRELERAEFANGYLIRSSFDRSSIQVAGREVTLESNEKMSCAPSWLAGRTMLNSKQPVLTCDAAMKEIATLANIKVDHEHLDEGSLSRAVDMSTDPNRAKDLKKVLGAYRDANKTGSISMNVLAGPKDLKLLEETKPSLASSLDFWFVGFIAQPMLSFLRFTHRFVNSWAFAIIILTILVKLLLLPLTQKSFTQMQRMQQLKPEMDALRKKFKDDKQKQQVETMNLYKRHRINPLGGCLPMVFQMPVYIALYRTIYSSVDLYQQPLFSAAWIPDMTQPDPFYILPIALALFMVVQQMFSPMGAGGDEMQQKLMKWMMPIMFGGFMLFLPSGLVLYIFINTLLTIIQQWVIRNKMATSTS